MSVAYQLLCIEAFAQPVAIDDLLGFIKKRKVLLAYQFVGLVARLFARR